MELYERILQSDDPKTMALEYKSMLKQEHNLLNKTMTGIMMTMNYGNTTYEKELAELEDKIDKIDTCLALTRKQQK